MLMQIFDYFSSVFLSLFNSFLSDWGFIGLSIVFVFVIVRVVNFVKRLFR